MTMKRIAVIGINHNAHMGMSRLISKLRSSLHSPHLTFYQCGPSGWDLYNRVLGLNVDKIIVLDQFEGDADQRNQLSFLTINERILIIGIDPIYFTERALKPELRGELQQILFQIKRMIDQEISLDSVVEV